MHSASLISQPGCLRIPLGEDWNSKPILNPIGLSWTSTFPRGLAFGSSRRGQLNFLMR